MVWVIVGQLGWLFSIVICFVLILCDIYTIVEMGSVYIVDKMNVKCWGLFLILMKKVKLTDSRGMWIRVWGLMEKDGTYIVWRVWWLVEENRTHGASGFFFNIYTWGARGVMCMDRSVREGVCFCAYILKGFQIFYLVGCFVMGRLWWLIFHGDKEGIFFYVLL